MKILGFDLGYGRVGSPKNSCLIYGFQPVLSDMSSTGQGAANWRSR